MTMFHRFHPETHEYLGSRVAPVDPVESAMASAAALAAAREAGGPDATADPVTVYAEPGRYDTTVAPPEVGENQVAVWGGSAWSLVDDYRGETFWLSYTESYVVEEIGTPDGTAERPAAAPPTADDLRAYAANKRWQIETSGCVWSGHTVQTDRDSQSKLIAEFVAMGAGLRADPSPWKFGDGFALVSNADMGAVIMAARTHVATAFAVEADVLAEIAAGTITTTAEIDAADWPSNT